MTIQPPKYFLERIAAHILEEHGGSLERQCIVFPNRRAGLYFLKYLASLSGKPVWAPSVRTINELFRSLSLLKVAENETLVFELYRVYRNLNPRAESFDDFYFWGEMLLNDFDDVDKYIVDAGKLFKNLSDLQHIEDSFGGLTDEQVNIIRQFWKNFRAGNHSDEKADFLEIWTILPDLYRKFRESLASKGIAYEGMIFREIADKCSSQEQITFNRETFHFVGFNALNKCEKKLMNYLKKSGLAKFYWDYDLSYTGNNPDHSAGYFLRSNLKEFGNDMPGDWTYETMVSLSGGSSRKIIEASSDIAQVKLIPRLLGELKDLSGDEACHTAIVLADEKLMLPLLSSIPESVNDVNITMGYPLRFSPVYSLLKNLLALQQNCRIEEQAELFAHIDIFNILRHSYFSGKSDNMTDVLINELIEEGAHWIPSERFKEHPPFDKIFRHANDPVSLQKYLREILGEFYISHEDDKSGQPVSWTEIMIRNEFIYKTVLVLNRIEALVSSGEITITTSTFARLLDRILAGISVPFTGEPLKGIQVMGILETRALDFRNLIILSMNEGVIPRGQSVSSYIPFNLREAFGLPGIRHQDSIYSYYFYRLLHRAENVTFVYNSNSEGLRTGEMSRLLLQLNYLDSNPPQVSGLSYNIRTGRPWLSVVQKNENHIRKLEELFTGQGIRPLSPSAVNTWLGCRMKFYYRYVCGLEEPDRIVTEIEPSLFGALLHGIMEKIYSRYKGKTIDREILGTLLKDNIGLAAVTLEIVTELYNKGRKGYAGGNENIISGILQSYARLIMRRDMTAAPFTLVDLEKKVRSDINIVVNDRKLNLVLGGFIDRLDKTGDTLRILDYKTGSIPMQIRTVESLFDENDEKRNEAWFQVLMYCEILYSVNPGIKLKPSVYALRSLSDPSFSDNLQIADQENKPLVLENYASVKDIFATRLVKTLTSIFDSAEPFRMTEHSRKCSFCPYSELCMRR